jgi:hypothetical protein
MKKNILILIVFAVISVNFLLSNNMINYDTSVTLNKIDIITHALASSESNSSSCNYYLRYTEHNGVVYLTCVLGGSMCCPSSPY